MTTINPTACMTPEELETMPNSKDYELVGGTLVERNMGLESSEIATQIIFLIRLFIKGKLLGRLFDSEAGYRCFPDDPGKVRKPDVSFIRMDRLPDGRAPKGFSIIAPDLAIEVISPGDRVEEIDEKVEEYLGAGVALVWVVNPHTRAVRIHRPKSSPRGSVSQLSVDDAINGEDVLPGFSCRVGEFFE